MINNSDYFNGYNKAMDEIGVELDRLHAENSAIKCYWYGRWKIEEKRAEKAEAELTVLKRDLIEAFGAPAIPMPAKFTNDSKTGAVESDTESSVK